MNDEIAAEINSEMQMPESVKQEYKYSEVLSDGEDGDLDPGSDVTGPAGKLVDLRKLDLRYNPNDKSPAGDAALKDGVRQMDREIVICKNLKDVQDMFEGTNILKGFQTNAKQKEIADKKKAEEDAVKIFRIPPEMFEDFQEIDDNNEQLFEFVAYQLVCDFLEHVCLRVAPAGGEAEEDEAQGDDSEANKAPRWDTALEFPVNLPSEARSKLHEIGNFFGLAHHSGGDKDKRKKDGRYHRRLVMYPKTLFIEKQEREKTRLQKERDEYYEHYMKLVSFPEQHPDHLRTFREQVMHEVWLARFAKNKVPDAKAVTSTMLIGGNDIGKSPDPEKLKILIKQKRADLAREQERMAKDKVHA